MSAQTATVVVVDDDAAVRKSLSRLLKAAGYRVVVTATATEFLECASRVARPCCVILDVRLPDLDGLDLQARLGPDGLAMPIVFITGHGDVPMSVRAMKAGAVDFLPKPFEPRHLLEAVRVALERAGQTDAARCECDRVQRLLDALTPLERQVLDLLVTGLSNKQIGLQLGMAESTVKIHRGRIM